MATQVAQPVKVTSASAVSAPDPSTLSARERIRLHVQRNIQQQQQQQELQNKDQQQGNERKKQHAASQRKRSHAETTGQEGGEEDSWETNTPPTSAAHDDHASVNLVKDGDGEEEDAFTRAEQGRYKEVEDECAPAEGEDSDCPSPPSGMMPAGLNTSHDIGLEVGAAIYANPTDEDRSPETAISPSKDLGICDSPPTAYEVSHTIPMSASSRLIFPFGAFSRTSARRCIFLAQLPSVS